MTNSQTNYDLEERTTQFSGKLIIFLKKIPQTSIFIPLVNQCLRSGTSIGANYREANGASSRKDFLIKFLYARKKQKKHFIGWKL